MIWSMLKNHIPHQTELEVVTLEDLVPAEHLVRKIETTINSNTLKFAIRQLKVSYFTKKVPTKM